MAAYGEIPMAAVILTGRHTRWIPLEVRGSWASGRRTVVSQEPRTGEYRHGLLESGS